VVHVPLTRRFESQFARRPFALMCLASSLRPNLRKLEKAPAAPRICKIKVLALVLTIRARLCLILSRALTIDCPLFGARSSDQGVRIRSPSSSAIVPIWCYGMQPLKGMVAAILMVLRLRNEFVLLTTVLGRTVKRTQRGWIH
jgi:hypothetical protein